MGDKWIFDVRSFWVIAEKEGLSEDWGWGKDLTDPASVLTTETNGVIDLPAFSNLEWAEKYIRDGDLQEVEPVLFGESVVRAAGFLQCMVGRGVAHMILDPIWGHKNVRVILVKDLLRDTIAELDKHAPPDH
jgi:hypothetical protein